VKKLPLVVLALSVALVTSVQAQAWRDCVRGSIGPGGCESIGPGGGLSIGPGGGQSIGPGGGQSIGPGGGQSIGPGGGQSIRPATSWFRRCVRCQAPLCAAKAIP
jgi:hypothetical protein